MIGSSPDATRVATSEQCALHWTSPTGSIDVRYPADPELLPDAQAHCEHLLTIPKEDRGYTGQGEDIPPGAAPTGRDRYANLFVMPPDADGSCRTIQITVYDDDLARARAAGSDISATSYDPQVPLVRESRDADRIPEVSDCGRAAGPEPEIPNLGGPVTDLGTEAAPADALRAFLTTQGMPWSDLPRVGIPGNDVPRALLSHAARAQGFIELTLPDGSIAYATEYDGFVATVIHAVPTTDGWTIESWETSGCW